MISHCCQNRIEINIFIYKQCTIFYSYILKSRPIMEIEWGEQIEEAEKVRENKVIRYKKLLQANRSVQKKVEQFIGGLKKRLAQLDHQIFQKKFNAPTQFEMKLRDQKIRYQSIYDQEFIRSPSAPDSRIVRKILASETHQKVSPQTSFWISQQPNRAQFLQIAQKQSITGIQVYRKWKATQQTKKITFMNQNQLKILVEGVRKYGKNWDRIGLEFPNRSHQQLQKNYNDWRKDNEAEQERWKRWTLRQNVVLLVLVEHIKKPNWAQMSKKMPEKTELMIRERYCNILSPQISKNVWSEFQQKQLKIQAPLYQYSWSKMVKQLEIFHSKTDNALRRKYRALIIDKSQEQIKRIIGQKHQDLAKSIINNKFNRSRDKKIIRIKNTTNF